jgi:tripartite-type tricarboxylate transporter receptor subunit TctC
MNRMSKALALLLLVFASATVAQVFPGKPVRIIVPFPPGAATDILGRLLAQKYSESWAYPAIVENRPGAGSLQAAEISARSPADGHTIFMGHIGTHGANPAMYAKLPYDAIRDFAPISLLVTIPNLLAVHPSVAATSVRELIELARSKPGVLNVASPGIGTSAHLIIALFKATTGVDMTHVPFKGSINSMQALTAGDVQVAFDSVTTLLPQARSGAVRVLAITSKQRSPLAPDVAPLNELGVPGFDVATWFAFFVPAGTPQGVIERLNGDTVRILRQRETVDRLNALGMNVVASSSAELADHVVSEIARWGKLVREANIRIE